MGERSVQHVRLFCESKRASGGDLSQCADLGAERTEKTTAEHLHQRDAHDRAHCQRQNRHDGQRDRPTTQGDKALRYGGGEQAGAEGLLRKAAPARRRPRGAGNANA